MTKKITIFVILFLFLSLFCQIQTFAISDPSDVKTSGNQIVVGENGENTRYDIDKDKDKDIDQFNKKLEDYNAVITFIGGIATMTMVAIFMKHCIKLATLGTEHWALKRNSIVGLMWSGIAAALLGGSTIFFAITYNLFK